MISSKPTGLNPEGSLNPIFNVSDFLQNNSYVTFADLLNYANLYSANIFSNINTFLGIQTQTIYVSKSITLEPSATFNGVTGQQLTNDLNLISYLPNIINDIQGITYDLSSNTTDISNNILVSDWLGSQNDIVTTNLTAQQISSLNLFSPTIETQSINCNQISINNNPLYQIACYLHINNAFSFPIIKSISINDLNLSINTLSLTLLPNYRVDFVDLNANILYSATNSSNAVQYNTIIPFNSNMISINLYDLLNNIIN